MARAGFTFDIAPSGVDEQRLVNESPDAFVVRIAMAKATAVSIGSDDRRLVLGADTIVVVDGTILGKPRDTDDAISMLRRLSGRTHQVLTGVAVHTPHDQRGDVESTRVTFRELTAGDIAWYVGSREPAGKAGAYAIQGRASRFVTRIEGVYTNVVGLPIGLVDRLLRALQCH